MTAKYLPPPTAGADSRRLEEDGEGWLELASLGALPWGPWGRYPLVMEDMVE